MPALSRLSAFVLALAALVPAMAQKTPIRIVADLSDAPRKLYHAEVDLPVTSGPLTLTTPKWIPGHHMPSGPVNDITGVVFTANGQTLAWRRDDVDLYQYHLTIPKGVTTLHAHLDAIVTSRVTQKIAVLEWEKLLLYPAGIPVHEIAIEPAVKVPAGWGIGTALAPVGAAKYPVPEAGAVTQFAATNVEQLEDSPIISGQYFHEYELAKDVTPKHYIDVVSDEPEDAELRPALLAELNNLVREAGTLYGSHHYGLYHFLLTLSDVAGGEGLEHGQSSDNGVGEKGFSDAEHQSREADLLPHEFTHSWNGKYRRPAGLYQPDFATAQQGALLWVYEGMTQYWGNVLAARAGLATQQEFLDDLAMTAASLDTKSGRAWRSTEDTAIAASILRGGNPAWVNWRRSQDYYPEGQLVWLDADTQIRALTGGKKSLDDFVKIFLGKGGNTASLIVPYTFDEVVKDLNTVVAYDWAKFLDERINKINPRADVAGIERGGYKLVYKDKPLKGAGGRGGVDVWYSLGARVSGEGQVADVRWGGVADKAKLAPGDKILAVNDRTFSPDVLKKAVHDSKTVTTPIRLIVSNESFVRIVEVDYHDGERYPALERVEGKPALLDAIAAPLTKLEKVDEEKKDK
jgi:predicted metalloprotease with PDZ domain